MIDYVHISFSEIIVSLANNRSSHGYPLPVRGKLQRQNNMFQFDEKEWMIFNIPSYSHSFTVYRSVLVLVDYQWKEKAFGFSNGRQIHFAPVTSTCEIRIQRVSVARARKILLYRVRDLQDVIQIEIEILPSISYFFYERSVDDSKLAFSSLVHHDCLSVDEGIGSNMCNELLYTLRLFLEQCGCSNVLHLP